jgi:Glycosyl hydrolases family 18
MSTVEKSVNAWIFLLEDEPTGTGYKSPNSCFQSMLDYGVYNSTDMVSIWGANTVPTGGATIPSGDGSTFTIQLQQDAHSDGTANQDYMDWLIEDARKANPDIKLLICLGFDEDELTRIFSQDSSQWRQNATDYAGNVLAYLNHYGLDGLDVDWEYPLARAGTPQQFALVFTAIRAAFATQPKPYYLTLSPASVGTLDAPTVNNAFDFVNLQLYSGFTEPGEYTAAGISQSLLAYGAKFESAGDGQSCPYQDAQSAYQGYTSGGYTVATQWRLNSGNYQFEQAQQMILHQLVHGVSDAAFDDAPIIGAAGHPPITQLVVRSGEVLDSLQATNSGSYSGCDQPLRYVLAQHGGTGGQPSVVTLAPGDLVAEISGYTGTWFGWDCVLQLTVTTRGGAVFGPFGSMNNASSQMPFSYAAPPGQSIVAFTGTAVDVPMAGGGANHVIASLTPTYG